MKQFISTLAILIGTVTFCSTFASASEEDATVANHPNIVLILADDFGWGDASCNNPDSPLATPAIDRIANEGIPAGATTDQLIGLTDMLATIAELCGEPLPDGAGPDSFNQLPALLQQKNDIAQRPALVTASYRGFLTIRQDNWKAVFGTKWTGGHTNVLYGGRPPKGTPRDDPSVGQLYNLRDDPFEQQDLWESRPDVVKKLRVELERIQQLENL